MLTQQLVGVGLETAEAERLMMLYGTEAVALVNGGVAAEARHAVLKEGALTLEDYWVRRSARARFDLDGGIACAATRCRRDGAAARLVGRRKRDVRSKPARASSRGTRAARRRRTERR